VKILQTLNNLRIVDGGPPRSVVSMSEGLMREGHSVNIFCHSNFRDNEILPSEKGIHINRCRGYRLPLSRAMFSLKCSREFSLALNSVKYDLVHDHSLWLPFNRIIAMECRSRNIPLVISPRGTLEPWCMDNSRIKKKIVWLLWQKNILNNASGLCATSLDEANNIRQLGIRTPIAVIPNGIEIPSPNDNRPKKNRYVLFMSRVHRKKGLIELVEAWNFVRPIGWRVVVAGPDDGGHLEDVVNLINRYKLTNDFDIVGHVEGERKADLFSRASLFVLPTYSENFGNVIAEAMAYGLPVITTKGAPWRVLEEKSCGWWVDIGVESLANAIQEATNMTSDKLQELGGRARDVVKQNFSIDHISSQFEKFYQYLLCGENKPNFVID